MTAGTSSARFSLGNIFALMWRAVARRPLQLVLLVGLYVGLRWGLNAFWRWVPEFGDPADTVGLVAVRIVGALLYWAFLAGLGWQVLAQADGRPAGARDYLLALRRAGPIIVVFVLLMSGPGIATDLWKLHMGPALSRYSLAQIGLMMGGVGLLLALALDWLFALALPAAVDRGGSAGRSLRDGLALARGRPWTMLALVAGLILAGFPLAIVGVLRIMLAVDWGAPDWLVARDSAVADAIWEIPGMANRLLAGLYWAAVYVEFRRLRDR